MWSEWKMLEELLFTFYQSCLLCSSNQTAPSAKLPRTKCDWTESVCSELFRYFCSSAKFGLGRGRFNLGTVS